MWFFAFILLCVILWDFFFCDCHYLDILFNFFLKIDLIWWDKFSCNFKYIFINEIGFIQKKIVLIVGKINKKVGFYKVGGGFAGPQGSGMGWESFPRHAMWGRDGARQYHAGQEWRPHPSTSLRPVAIPSHLYY